jgi:hypothetical protein
VAATIRTDRYEVMQTHPALAGIDTEVFDELRPMPPTQFKEVITGPATRASQAGHRLTVAPDLVERLLADTGAGADTLPVLSLTLARLCEDYGSSGELTLAQYEAMGTVARVVQTEIDGILASDPMVRASQLDVLHSAFIPWLATINPDNDQPLRRVARWTDLPEPSRPLIEAFVGKRLMVKNTRDGVTVVEVALESLLRSRRAAARAPRPAAACSTSRPVGQAIHRPWRPPRRRSDARWRLDGGRTQSFRCRHGRAG